MSNTRQWDSLELEALDLPYDLITRELSEKPRLVAGSQNSYITYGGKLIKRFGTIRVDTVVDTSLTKRVDRLWVYETLDTPSIIYLLASAYDTGTLTWGLYYIRLDAGGSPVWTSAGTLRDANASSRPHEMIPSRGLAYIKGYPKASSSEKLGTVIFDGTAGTPSLKFWGILGPSVPAHLAGSVPRLTSAIGAADSTFTLTAQKSKNLFLWSQAFDVTAAWTVNAVAVTANNTVAPNGVTSAALLTPSSSDSYIFQHPGAGTIGSSYTASVYLKSATGSTVNLSLNITDGTAGASSTVAATTTWQRFSVSYVCANAAGPTFYIGSGSTFSTGENIYAWGAQLEVAPSATYYIATYGPFSVPAAPFNVQIDTELITATAFNTSTGVASGILRGAQGTVPAVHNANSAVLFRDWTASAHPGSINLFWAYTYAYKSLTGQISNRAPLETNPDNNPSQTGPFLNLLPKFTLYGAPDTTNIPTIIVYRTTDGGGTFMKVTEVSNLGDFPISYTDQYLASQSGNQDPTADSALDSQNLAASLTTNSPPPTVLAPKVTGIDTPAASTPLASYSGRLWLGIGNVVFFSGNEELNTGIPEESFPAGLYGNFYRFQHPIVNLIATTDCLYILTTTDTYQVTGTNLETFNPRPILNDIGAAIGHPRAITRFGDTIIWLTNDLRVAILQGQNFRTISECLGTDFVDLINSKGAEIDIKYFAELDKEWVTLTAICPTVTDNRTWVYDVNKSTSLKIDFWNSPWNIQATATVSGRLRETQQQRRLCFFTWTGSTGFLTRIATTAADNLGYDAIPSALTTVFPCRIKTNLFLVPPGNHVNALRRPALLPVVYNFVVERSLFANDVDPRAFYYFNDFGANPIPTTPPNDPSRDTVPKGYKTLTFPVNQAGRRIAIEFQKTDTDLFEIQNLAITWAADEGSGI